MVDAHHTKEMINHPNLSHIVQQLLPDARIDAYALPKCELSLYLINEDFPKGPLPADIASAIMEQPYYWAFCWAAGLILARTILENPEWVADKTILDFGCGSGVVGIAAAKAGAKQVIACDLDPFARQAAQANAKLNRVNIDIVAEYKPQQSIDVLLAADILYDRDNWPLLAQFQQWAPTIWLSDSRVKNFNHPGFTLIKTLTAITLPDLGELDEFREVNIYYSQGNPNP